MKKTSYPLYQQISAFKIFFKYLFKVTFFIQLSDDKVSLIQILTFILELKKTFFSQVKNYKWTSLSFPEVVDQC